MTPALATSTSTGPCVGLDLGEGGLHGLRVGDVAADAEQPVGRLAERYVTATWSPRGGERPGDGEPDAAVAAGDEHRARFADASRR